MRIYLSVPHMSGHEQSYLRDAFASNWISSVGPNVDALEREVEERIGAPVAAVASGTAAIHLGLRLLGVGPGDEVFCSTLTFVASGNPILYLGARPVLVDSNYSTWNLDPDLLADALRTRARQHRLPRAVVVVHLYGQCADMGPILEVCGGHGVPVLEDAAEALGARYGAQAAGTLGEVGVFSLNGNKIITGSGGGLLVARDRDAIVRAKMWAAQARLPGVGYEHRELGYNYGMSNVVAGIARGQLHALDHRVCARREVAFGYRAAFADLAGISLMPQCDYGLHTNWLSTFVIDERAFGATRDDVLQALDAAGIEARPVWKPLHLQRLFRGVEVIGGAVAQDLHRRGICLPSSSSLTADEQDRVVRVVRSVARRRRVMTQFRRARLSNSGEAASVHLSGGAVGSASRARRRTARVRGGADACGSDAQVPGDSRARVCVCRAGAASHRISEPGPRSERVRVPSHAGSLRDVI